MKKLNTWLGLNEDASLLDAFKAGAKKAFEGVKTLGITIFNFLKKGVFWVKDLVINTYKGLEGSKFTEKAKSAGKIIWGGIKVAGVKVWGVAKTIGSWGKGILKGFFTWGAGLFGIGAAVAGA